MFNFTLIYFYCLRYYLFSDLMFCILFCTLFLVTLFDVFAVLLFFFNLIFLSYFILLLCSFYFVILFVFSFISYFCCCFDFVAHTLPAFVFCFIISLCFPNLLGCLLYTGSYKFSTLPNTARKKIRSKKSKRNCIFCNGFSLSLSLPLAFFASPALLLF